MNEGLNKALIHRILTQSFPFFTISKVKCMWRKEKCPSPQVRLSIAVWNHLHTHLCSSLLQELKTGYHISWMSLPPASSLRSENQRPLCEISLAEERKDHYSCSGRKACGLQKRPEDTVMILPALLEINCLRAMGWSHQQWLLENPILLDFLNVSNSFLDLLVWWFYKSLFPCSKSLPAWTSYSSFYFPL